MCQVGNCNRRDAMPCAYVDRSGRVCGFITCIEHGATIGEKHYCRRHATILDALGISNTEGWRLPALENRNVSLVSVVALGLDPSIRAVMQHSALPGEHLVWDEHVTPHTNSQGQEFWRKTWSLVAKDGPVVEIAISAPDNVDAQIMLAANDRPLSVGVPAWIQRRKRGVALPEGADTVERQLYSDFVLEVIRKGINDVRSGKISRRSAER